MLQPAFCLPHLQKRNYSADAWGFDRETQKKKYNHPTQQAAIKTASATAAARLVASPQQNLCTNLPFSFLYRVRYLRNWTAAGADMSILCSVVTATFASGPKTAAPRLVADPYAPPGRSSASSTTTSSSLGRQAGLARPRLAILLLGLPKEDAASRLRVQAKSGSSSCFARQSRGDLNAAVANRTGSTDENAGG